MECGVFSEFQSQCQVQFQCESQSRRACVRAAVPQALVLLPDLAGGRALRRDGGQQH